MVLWLLLFSTSLWSKERLFLAPGVSQLLPAPQSQAIHISHPRLLSVKDLGSKLLLRGRKEGEAFVRIGNQEIRVHVLSPSTYRSFDEMGRFLKKRRGLNLEIESGNLLVNGNLLRPQDWLDLSRQARQRKWSYLFQARIPDDLHELLTTQIREDLKSKGLSGVRLNLAETPSATLPTGLKNQMPLYKTGLDSWGLQLQVSPEMVEAQPMVEVMMTLAEVRRQESQQFGVHWPTSFKAQILPLLEPEAVQLMLNAMEDQGRARILAKPRLSCRSGEAASFLAGGEIPLRIMNFRVNDIVWKKYGVQLNIKPRADRFGQMNIGIETEISTVDKGYSVEGFPAFLTNRIQSHFSLKGPRTISLSGLLKTQTGENQSGLPLLQKIPILGSLFSSREFLSNETELVVFVSARVQPEDQYE